MHKMHEGRLKSGMSAGDRTRERIMLAAEELVADVGPGGASARQIARIAGLKNNVSVQYHFGSMGKLFDEVIHYRGEMLEEIRQGMIDSYEKTDFEALSIEELWKIICLPQLKMKGADGRYQYAMFLCNYLPVHRPEGFSFINRMDTARLPALSRVLKQMRVLLLDIPLEVYERRITSANLLFLNTCRGLAPDAPENEQFIARNPVVRDAFRQSVAAITPKLTWAQNALN